MRLNMDCIRDILLCVEENTGLRKFCVFFDLEMAEKIGLAMGEPFDKNSIQPYQNKLYEKYDNDTLIYHVQYCIGDNLISYVTFDNNTSHIYIDDLEPAGHEMLNNLRDPSVLAKVKSILLKEGKSIGLGTLSSVITDVGIDVFKKFLGLP